MENQTKNTGFAEQTVDTNQYQAFNPKATLLLNVAPSDNRKTVVEPMKKQTPASKPEESPEKLLQELSLNTEPSPEKTSFAKRKWQLISLLTGILFITAAAMVVWLALETSTTRTQQARLEAENQSLREQVNLAGSQITGLKNDVESLLNRNIELTTENAKLKSQAVTPAKGQQKTAASKRTTQHKINRHRLAQAK